MIEKFIFDTEYPVDSKMVSKMYIDIFLGLSPKDKRAVTLSFRGVFVSGKKITLSTSEVQKLASFLFDRIVIPYCVKLCKIGKVSIDYEGDKNAGLEKIYQLYKFTGDMVGQLEIETEIGRIEKERQNVIIAEKERLEELKKTHSEPKRLPEAEDGKIKRKKTVVKPTRTGMKKIKLAGKK